MIFVIQTLLLFFFIANAQAGIDPYQDVSLVTNTIAWPYNQSTFGNDNYQEGRVEEGNADSLLLALVNQKQQLLFPADFQFGVAYAAYQYEGNRIEPSASQPYGVGWSLWDVFSQKGSWLNPKGDNISESLPTKRFTQPNGEYAIHGYQRSIYSKDIRLMKQLGVKTVRLSISWPRLFPHRGMQNPDPKAVKYYQTILRQLKAEHFEVLLTLYHWDLPAWLYNYGQPSVSAKDKTYGWLDVQEAKDNVTLLEYQKYAKACFKYFGPYTPYFATFNEPLTITNSGIYQGNHAPGKAGLTLLRQLNPKIYGINSDDSDKRLNYLMAANIIKAHYIAYKTFEQFRPQIMKANQGKAQLGIVLNADWAEPYRIVKQKNGSLSYHADDIGASKRHMDFTLGWFLEPVLFGNWPKSMQNAVDKRLPKFTDDKSCMNEDGKPQTCRSSGNQSLAQYIKTGGAVDYLMLNHYSGYFVTDKLFAQRHFSIKPAENSVGLDQYGVNPNHLKSGWASDQLTFTTQFRYQQYGSSGAFANDSRSRIYVIGKAGAQPWLRQTYFSYSKLLEYIDFYYLNNEKLNKQHNPINKLAIYLTENGTSLAGESQKTGDNQLHDPERIEFIKGNLAAVWQAMQHGINIKLYTYWSIADNFEWSEGYDSRFGLLWIDYQHHFKRLKKDSYYYFQKVIRENAVVNQVPTKYLKLLVNK